MPPPRFDLAWGEFGTGNGQFNVPTDAVAANGRVYVADTNNHRIQVFDYTGTFLFAFGQPEGLGAYLHIAWSPGDTIIVSDGNNELMHRFDRNGAHLNQWSFYSLSSTDGAIAVDPQGVVYIVHGETIYLYSQDGAWLRTLFPLMGAPSFRDVAFDSVGRMWTLNTQPHVSTYVGDTRVRDWGKFGVGVGYLRGSRGLAVTSSGEVLVADTDNHRVQLFSASGLLLTAWGGEGKALGEFQNPMAVLEDETGAVYVTDSGNNRIEKFAW